MQTLLAWRTSAADIYHEVPVQQRAWEHGLCEAKRGSAGGAGGRQGKSEAQCEEFEVEAEAESE